MTINIDPFSTVAVRLTMMRDDLTLAHGSGFLWSEHGRMSIVTAWHCLTGMHPETGRALSPTGARPNKVDVSLLSEDFSEAGWVINLYNADGAPNWHVHMLGSREIDIAALHLPDGLPPGVINTPANMMRTTDMEIRVGMDMFILGYPQNLHRFGLPIWKRASLAIDYQTAIDEPGHRHLLVDTASRKGMSGALVLARSQGGHRTEGSAFINLAPAERIVGIYTGRVGTVDALDAQIGIVWPLRWVRELIYSGVPDSLD